MLEDFRVAQRPGPSVGVGHGSVEVVVQLPERGDERGIVDRLVLRRERLTRPELFEDIIDDGESKLVLLLRALAVRVKLLASFRIRAFCFSVQSGKGKGSKQRDLL